MYSRRPGLILGFHGTDKSIRDKIVSHEIKTNPSAHSYDWLGQGFYFWENNPERAYDYAGELKEKGRKKIVEPAVLGAVIDLGYCLDLLNKDALDKLKQSYDYLAKKFKSKGSSLPANTTHEGDNLTPLMRQLDCAVIETFHEVNKELDYSPYDSIRAVFVEGNMLYPNAGFHDKNHIQICIRNSNCIKGFFIPRKLDPISL